MVEILQEIYLCPTDISVPISPPYMDLNIFWLMFYYLVLRQNKVVILLTSSSKASCDIFMGAYCLRLQKSVMPENNSSYVGPHMISKLFCYNMVLYLREAGIY